MGLSETSELAEELKEEKSFAQDEKMEESAEKTFEAALPTADDKEEVSEETGKMKKAEAEEVSATKLQTQLKQMQRGVTAAEAQKHKLQHALDSPTGFVQPRRQSDTED